MKVFAVAIRSKEGIDKRVNLQVRFCSKKRVCFGCKTNPATLQTKEVVGDKNPANPDATFFLTQKNEKKSSKNGKTICG
jgi:hypothetical protein